LYIKGKKAGSGGKVAHFMVFISYGKGDSVYFCEQYDKMYGPYFADFVKRNFRKLIRNSCNPSGKMFLQDGDPSQNSAIAREAMKKLGVQVHSIPP
jgi:trehalose utilization protein